MDSGIAWHESKQREGKEADSFSVVCNQITEAKFVPTGLNPAYYPGRFELHVPAGTYQFQPASSYAATLVLDRILVTCGLGEPALNSSRDRWGPKPDPTDSAREQPPEDGVSFDTSLETDGSSGSSGSSGVLFVSNTGLRYERVAPPPAPGEKRPPDSFISCDRLSAVTVPNVFSQVAIHSVGENEIDIHAGGQKHRFLINGLIPPKAVKQTLDSACPKIGK